MMVDDIPNRIYQIYSSCNQEEQSILRQILEEISLYGESETYEKIWLADYKEIPVSKETFLTSPKFLGPSNNNGASIYPRWMEVMKELEATGNQYYEIVFTGATRTGKTSTAVSDALYQLYRLMCLRDPQNYFNLKTSTTLLFFFFNITQTLAKGVAFKEFNTTIQYCPWFMEHGHMTASEANPVYVPEGGQIEIAYGSDASHALGRAAYCMIGTTEILTDKGVRSLAELADSSVNVAQIDPSNNIVYSNALVACTGLADKTIRIELEDGSIFEGTSDHKVMLSDGTYKCLGELKVDDSILASNHEGGGSYNLKISEITTIEHAEPILVYDVIDAKPNHNFIVCTEHSNIIAHNCVVFDECNFAAAGIKDINKAKARMKAKYDTLVARVTGTFVRNGEVYGKLYIISSKNSDSDFMEDYVAAQRKAGNPHMYIFDEPQWKVWPSSKYSSDKMFYIALGGRHLRSYVVPDDELDPDSLRDIEAQGYRLMEVPEDNKTRFLADFDIALRDIAGVSVPGTLSYITQATIDPCINHTRRCPFYNEVIRIGTKDTLTLEEFFHIEDVDIARKHLPMFIHLDLSLTTDRTGISGVWVSGSKEVQSIDESGTLVSQPTFTHVFSVALEAPKGDKIPYSKILAFICWLRKQGFNITGISRDQFQSEYMAQLLEEQGFTVSKLSLDRSPQGYDTLKSVLLEQRIDMLDNQLLQNELIMLQRDSMTGKLDHPANGAKDTSDSFAGAVWNATINNPGVVVPTTKVANVFSNVNSNRGLDRNSLGSIFGNFTKY